MHTAILVVGSRYAKVTSGTPARVPLGGPYCETWNYRNLGPGQYMLALSHIELIRPRSGGVMPDRDNCSNETPV